MVVFERRRALIRSAGVLTLVAVAACARPPRRDVPVARSIAPLPDSCVAVLAAAQKDSIRVNVRISLGVPNAEPDVRAFQRKILGEILQTVDYPDVLDTEMGAFRMNISGFDWATVGNDHSRDARLWFRSGSDGGLDSLVIVGHSTVPELAETLVRAIRNAGTIRRLGTPPAGLDHVNWHLFVYADSGHDALPVFDSLYVRFPRASPPARIEGNPLPGFPRRALRERAGGRVLTQMVIDSDGSVRMGTLRVLIATRMDYTKAVLAVLPKYRFMPARVGGCPVPVVAQVPFEFVLDP